MADELVFYTNPMSRGRIVRWMLEEIGAPYETQIVEFGKAKDAEYLAVNPMGKVPALRHGNVTVTESAAICAYLADAFPSAGLAPPPSARADYYRWLFFFAGPVEAAVTNKVLGVEVPDDRQGMVGYGNYEAVMGAIEHAVSAHEFIAGDTFSAADVYCGSQIGWGMQFGTIEKRPALAAYWQRISNREAYRRAGEIDDALLPEPPHPPAA